LQNAASEAAAKARTIGAKSFMLVIDLNVVFSLGALFRICTGSRHIYVLQPANVIISQAAKSGRA
jgi:hypothetical protein